MATSVEARTVSASAKSASLVDIKSLVLLAILLAAGFILNMTLGNALGIVGIKPQFIIAAYASRSSSPAQTSYRPPSTPSYLPPSSSSRRPSRASTSSPNLSRPCS